MISSGIVMSKLRSPASTCATGTFSFAAARAAAERRVHVADDDDEVGPLGLQHPLHADHHRRRLRRVRAALAGQLVIGARQRQLLEEHPRHGVVGVLAGVDEALLDRPGARAAAGISAAIFVKFGLVPTTWRTRGIAGMLSGPRAAGRQNAVLRPSANRRARSPALTTQVRSPSANRTVTSKSPS